MHSSLMHVISAHTHRSDRFNREGPLHPAVSMTRTLSKNLEPPVPHILPTIPPQSRPCSSLFPPQLLCLSILKPQPNSKEQAHHRANTLPTLSSRTFNILSEFLKPLPSPPLPSQSPARKTPSSPSLSLTHTRTSNHHLMAHTHSSTTLQAISPHRHLPNTPLPHPPPTQTSNSPPHDAPTQRITPPPPGARGGKYLASSTLASVKRGWCGSVLAGALS